MSFELNSLNVDLHGNKASATFYDAAGARSVSVNVPLATPGDQPESALRAAAVSALRQALLDSAAAL